MKKAITFLTTVLLTTALCLSIAYANTSFSDVSSSDWFYSNVQSLVDSGAISGYEDGTFRPYNSITRAEFAKILVKAMKIQPSEGDDFADTKTSWAKSYISAAITNGIIVKSEYGDNFLPDEQISRLEIAKMIVRALHITPSSKSGPFEDLTNEYTTAAYNEYLIMGTQDNGRRYFYPNNKATRAEASAMVERAVNYKADPDGYKKAAAASQKDNYTSQSDAFILNVSNLPDEVYLNSLDEFKSYLMTAVYLKKPQITLNVSYYNDQDYGFDSIKNYISDVNFDKCYEKGYAAGCGIGLLQTGDSASIKLDFQYYDYSGYGTANIKKIVSQDELNAAIGDAVSKKQSALTLVLKNCNSYYYDFKKALQRSNTTDVLSNGYYLYYDDGQSLSLLNNSIKKVSLLYRDLDFDYKAIKTVSNYQEYYKVLSDAVAKKEYKVAVAMNNYDSGTYNLGKALLDINKSALSEKGYCARVRFKLEYATTPKTMQIYLEYKAPYKDLVFKEDEGKPILHNEQEWYEFIKNALSSNQTENQFNLTYSSDMGDALEKVWSQNADINHAYSYTTGSDGNITFTYKFPQYTLQQMRAQTDAMADQIIGQIIYQGMTETEKARAIHDYLVLNTKYDIDNYNNGTIPNEDYTAYGVLVNKTGVCQGYAAAFKLLAEKVGLHCISVSGFGNGGRHAWNMVRLDGVVGYIDATFDDPVPDQGTVRYNYFFISKAEMSKDHTWNADDFAEKYLDY